MRPGPCVTPLPPTSSAPTPSTSARRPQPFPAFLGVRTPGLDSLPREHFPWGHSSLPPPPASSLAAISGPKGDSWAENFGSLEAPGRSPSVLDDGPAVNGSFLALGPSAFRDRCHVPISLSSLLGQFWPHLLDTGPLFPPPGWGVTSDSQSLEPREPKLQKARVPPSPQPWTGKQNRHHCWPSLVRLGSVSILALPQAQQLSHTGWLPWLTCGLPEKGQRVPLDRDLSHPGSSLDQLHDPRQLISHLRASLSSLANGGPES